MFDEETLRAFRRGDRAALAEVFRAYVEDVARTLRAGVVVEVGGERVRLGARLPEPDVEALIQEVFARAFSANARASYDGIRPYGAYLATIARNLLVDRARSERRDARIAAAVSSAEGEPEPEDPAKHVDDVRARALLARLRASLSGAELDVYRRRFEQELSLRETAAALGVGVMVVRRIDGELRERIAHMLAEEGYPTDESETRDGDGNSIDPHERRKG